MPKKISSTQSAPTDRKTALLFCLVLAFSLFLFFFRLGDRPFRNPDEGRYAAISREMVVSGDWGVPTIFGLSYLKKPILFYWLVAGSFKAFGANEWSARLVPALFGVLGVLAVFGFCLRTYDRKTAVIASLMLATNFWYLQVGRYLVIDMVFSFFLVTALLSFYTANQSSKPATKNFYLLFFALLGFAFIAKGPVSLAVVGCPILVYLAMTKRFGKTFFEMKWGGGLLLFGGIALPWFVWMSGQKPHFLKQFFGHENLNRVLSSSFEHQQPWYYYFLIMIPMLAPWVFFWRPLKGSWERIVEAAQEGDPRFFMFVCGFVTLLFFSLAKSKMPTYILPAVVFFIVPIAYGWRHWIAAPLPKRAWVDGLPIALLMLAGIGLIVVSPWYVLERSAGKYPAQIVNDFQLLGGVLLGGGVFCARILQQNRREKFFYALVVWMAFVSCIFPLAMETMNPNYSTKAFAAKLSRILEASDEVYVYDQPGAFYDFGFYLNRPVKLVGLEGELEFSRVDEKASSTSISHEQFNKILLDGKMVYCLIRKSDYEGMPPDVRAHTAIVSEDMRKILFKSGVSGGKS